jgi:protein-disulfide isomerase/uncharacterized membrane protein
MNLPSATYNTEVKSAFLNRILIILGLIGCYIAGVLTIQHAFQLDIPCTAGGGCEVVARHPSSYIPITIGAMRGIPVAYLGLLGYVILTILAGYRAFAGKYQSPRWVGAGFFIAAIGMLYSVYLQYISFFEIHAKCIWCMSSAVTMIATFVTYALLLNETNKEVLGTVDGLKKDLILAVAGIGVAYLCVFVTTMNSRKANLKIQVIKVDDIKQLIPDRPNQIGPSTAAVTVVEFADLCCGACRNSISKIKEIREKYGDKIRFVYRHFPLDQLPGHEMTLVASVSAEVAADEGKFWQFVEGFVATAEPVKTQDEVFAIAEGAGVSKAKIIKALEDSNSAQQARVIRDYETALKLKLNGTPQFVLYIKGEPIRTLNGLALMAELDSPDIQKYLK